MTKLTLSSDSRVEFREQQQRKLAELGIGPSDTGRPASDARPSSAIVSDDDGAGRRSRAGHKGRTGTRVDHPESRARQRYRQIAGKQRSIQRVHRAHTRGKRDINRHTYSI